MEFLKQLGLFLLTAAVIGVATHFIGEALPRNRFNCRAFPFAPYKWERGGRLYNKLKIEKWKSIMPDKSRYVQSTVRKSVGGDRGAAHMEQLAKETCVAEAVHWGLWLISPVVLLINESPYSWIFCALYGLSNLPFIMIQRYNRPRLLRAAERAGRTGGKTL